MEYEAANDEILQGYVHGENEYYNMSGEGDIDKKKTTVADAAELLVVPASSLPPPPPPASRAEVVRDSKDENLAGDVLVVIRSAYYMSRYSPEIYMINTDVDTTTTDNGNEESAITIPPLLLDYMTDQTWNELSEDLAHMLRTLPLDEDDEEDESNNDDADGSNNATNGFLKKLRRWYYRFQMYPDTIWLFLIIMSFPLLSLLFAIITAIQRRRLENLQAEQAEEEGYSSSYRDDVYFGPYLYNDDDDDGYYGSSSYILFNRNTWSGNNFFWFIGIVNALIQYFLKKHILSHIEETYVIPKCLQLASVLEQKQALMSPAVADGGCILQYLETNGEPTKSFVMRFRPVISPPLVLQQNGHITKPIKESDTKWVKREYIFVLVVGLIVLYAL